MPGWLRQPWISFSVLGILRLELAHHGEAVRYFRAASIAITLALGSQLIGGWISAASTPASSISFSTSSAVTS